MCFKILVPKLIFSFEKNKTFILLIDCFCYKLKTGKAIKRLSGATWIHQLMIDVWGCLLGSENKAEKKKKTWSLWDDIVYMCRQAWDKWIYILYLELSLYVLSLPLKSVYQVLYNISKQLYPFWQYKYS